MGILGDVPEDGRRLIPLLLTLSVLLSLSSFASARMCQAPGETNCCRPCGEPFYFRWPTKSIELVENSIDSTCEGDEINGIDIKAADGEPVYAVMEGRIRTVQGVLGDFNNYDCGCGVVLESTDGSWRALYCHLFDERQWLQGYNGIVKRGDVLGHAGGDQNNSECRGGNDEGPKMHFELWYSGGGWAPVDPNSCFMDTCGYYYTTTGNPGDDDCVPHEGDASCKITPKSTGKIKWPTYASPPPYNVVGAATNAWYARAKILRTGVLDIENSRVYDINLQQVPTDNLNYFLKPVRIYSDGRYVCGRINGNSIDYDINYCADLVGVGLTQYKRDGSLGSNSIQFMDYKLAPAGGTDSNYGKYFTVSEEYDAIGADDHDLINRYHNNPLFNVELDDTYYVDYILARRCDLQGTTIVTMSCKSARMGYYNETYDYEENVALTNYTDCEWEIADAGRYYDYPGLYLSQFNFSRMATYTGFGLYTIGEETLQVGISHITDDSIDQSRWWNRNSGKRILGCDGCEKMNDNIACTMGSSIAQNNYYFNAGDCLNLDFSPNTGNPPYYPDVDCYLQNGLIYWGCGFWDKKGADYFGFNDRDDDSNIKQDGKTDTSYDKESGIPDKDLIRQTLESVKSEVSIYVIIDVDWKGPPNWIRIYDPGDSMSIFWSSQAAHKEDWLMPCKVETTMHCFSDPSVIVTDNVLDSSACQAAGYTTCSGWRTYPAHPDCDHHDSCTNSAGQSCTIAKGCNPHPKWTCLIERTDSGHEGDICQHFCCLGGVRITDYTYKKNILDYQDFPNHQDRSGTEINDNELWAANPAVLADDDLVRDRFWITDPVEGAASYGSSFSGTRPRYDSGTSGRDGNGRPESLHHNPCNACRAADTCPELCMNWDLKYYRQYNMESPWARIFKVTPEVNLFYDSSYNFVDSNPACVKMDLTPDTGKMGLGQGGCIDTTNCTAGLTCVFPQGLTDPKWGHCCPGGTKFDLGYTCCMGSCAVEDRYLYASDYCQKKMDIGCQCKLGEGTCTSDAQCEGDLKCKNNINSGSPVDTACCNENQNWTGKDCVPLASVTPWFHSYTRTGGGNSNLESGGGPVWFMAGGGAMIPDIEEAAGYWNEWCNDWDKQCMNAKRFKDVPNQQSPGNGNPVTQPRYVGKSPIWFETKNLGVEYVREQSHELDNEIGLYCWSYIWPYVSGWDTWGNTRDCNKWDCNCGRDMDQNGDREDANCPNVQQQTSCMRGSLGGGGQGSSGPEHRCVTGPSSGDMTVYENMPVPPQADRIPATCGEIYRKDVENYPDIPGPPIGDKKAYGTPESWFNYSIWENGNKVVDDEPTPRARNNILPMPTGPWTLLDFQPIPMFGYQVGDSTRDLEAEVKFSTFNQFKRRVIVEECIWRGCSRLEEVLTTVIRITLIAECGDPPEVTTCSGCQHKRDYCCMQDGLALRAYCGWDCICGDPPRPCTTRYYDQCFCKDLCWGCWHHEGMTYAYPVSKPNPDTGEEEVEFEIFNETSTVISNRYGSHLELEGPISSGNNPFQITVNGLINYKIPWKPKSNYANGYLTVKVTDTQTEQLDMLNGFDLEIQDSVVLRFVSTDFPYSHDLTSLESAPGIRYVEMTGINSNFIGHGLEFPGSDKLRPTYDPIRAYYFRQDQYKGYSARYNRLKDFHQKGNFGSMWWTEITPGIGLFSNYQEDYKYYYDMAGFSPMPLDVKAFSTAPLEGMAKNVYNVQQEPFSDKFVEHVNAYVDYAPDCESSGYEENNCGNCNPDMCTDKSVLTCTGGVCDCRYKPGEPVSPEICKEVNDWDHYLIFDCDDPRSNVQSHCTRDGYQAYWRDKIILKYRWDAGANNCAIQMVKPCVPFQAPQNSYTLIFDSQIISPKKYDNATLTIYTPLRSIKVQPFNSGMAENCEGPVSVQQGNLRLSVSKPHPIRGEVRRTGDTTVIVVGIDGCTGQDVNSGYVYINFVAPYTRYSGYYAVNSIITFDSVKEGAPIISTNDYVDNQGLINSPVSQSVIIIKNPAMDVWNYFLDNMWIILIGLVAVMSYRFFSGRVMDFQEAIQQWKRQI